MFDRKRFFDAIRPHVNLTTQNVAGMERVLEYAEKRNTSIDKLAYIIATAWWETAQTMQPVREAYWLSEGWRSRNLRYYPFYGRGLIQTTWEENYRKMGERIGADLVSNPDMLLEWRNALPALFVGMEEGLYTGRDLDDYIDDIDEDDDEDRREYINARRIVNGVDKAMTIADLALAFEKALRASWYDNGRQPDDPGLDAPELAPAPLPHPTPPETAPEPPQERGRLPVLGIGVAVGALLYALRRPIVRWFRWVAGKVRGGSTAGRILAIASVVAVLAVGGTLLWWVL